MEETYDDEFQVNQLTNFGVTYEDNLLTHMRRDWEKRRLVCVLQVICCIVHALYLIQMLPKYVPKSIGDVSSRDEMRQQLMKQLLETDKTRDVIRMGPSAFLQLCEKLRGTGRVKDSIRATVEEQVARFLHILAHNLKHRVISFFFHRSEETISRHFHDVLRAVISLAHEFLVQPSSFDVPPQILHSSRYYPFFKVGIVLDYS